MTEQNPEDLTAKFHLDQREAAAEQADEVAFWANVRRVEATTTLEQRQALTKRVEAQAALLHTLQGVLIVAAVFLTAWATWAGVGAIIGAFVEAIR